ncbi:MAG: S9 family peptidase [Candidatus Eisenbacteria bacterium]
MTRRFAGAYGLALLVLFAMATPFSPRARAATATPAAALTPWKWGDALGVRLSSDPRISPDGSRIVWVVSGYDADSSAIQTDLWLLDLTHDGTAYRALTHSNASEWSPRWAPDGQSIAFLCDRTADGAAGGTPQVWTLPLRGGDPTPLTNAENGVTRFEWFAHGLSLAYLAPQGATAAGRARAARKDDLWIASEHPGAARVWTFELATKKALAVTPADSFVTAFDTSPDGGSVVYSTQPEPGPNGRFDTDLWVATVPLDERTPRPAPRALVRRPGMDAQPKYSPDGRWIAFVSQHGARGGSADDVSLAVVPAAGGGATNLMPHFAERVGGALVASEPVWMPDNESVLFVSSDRTNVRVYRAFTDDRPVEPVTRDAGVSDWPATDRAQKLLAWVHEDATHPSELWVWEFERSAPRAYSSLNDWTKKKTSFPAQVVQWPGADGRTIEGLLFAPAHARPGVKPPLLLYVHGGPASNHAEWFTPVNDGFDFAVWLERGWAILMPNPRGSAGYGLEWRKANTRDWAVKPFEDCMLGVEQMVRLGLADSTRLAISGWSYGGYMTSNAVTRTNRFRAAVAGAGPVNLVAQTGSSDIPGLMRASMDAWPWEDPQVYVDNSPIVRAKFVRTPTAFVHGEKDVRVDISESWQMYRALRGLGVPTDFLKLPREGHGPQEPRHLRVMNEWIYDWIARWTLAPAAPAKRANSGGFK